MKQDYATLLMPANDVLDVERVDIDEPDPETMVMVANSIVQLLILEPC